MQRFHEPLKYIGTYSADDRTNAVTLEIYHHAQQVASSIDSLEGQMKTVSEYLCSISNTLDDIHQLQKRKHDRKDRRRQVKRAKRSNHNQALDQTHQQNKRSDQ
jgi:hypothetical protein